jgi:Methylamine utilisation protein MauE
MPAGVAMVTVPLVLLVSFAGHLLRPTGLPRALRAHRTLPAALITPIAVMTALAEAATGTLALTGFARPALAAACALLTGYAGYGTYVLRTRPSVPCGCAGSGDTYLTGWVVARAVALAVLALVGSVAAVPLPHGGRLVITVLAGVVFAVLLWTLPLALHDPERIAAG